MRGMTTMTKKGDKPMTSQYQVKNKATGMTYVVPATSKEEACKICGWNVSECDVWLVEWRRVD